MKEYTKRLREKGWLSKDVANLWGITARGMSKIAANPKERDWCALRGLPPVKRSESR